MSGGTGAVTANCGGAQLAIPAEHRSGAGTAFQPWQLQTQLELHALPTAPACARGHVRTVAREWGLAGLADTAELLASELLSNALTQASGPRRTRDDPAAVPVVRLWMISDKSSIIIKVWDASDEMPVRRNAGPEEVSGRGLMLVEALARDWGAYRTGIGKVVWVRITG